MLSEDKTHMSKKKSKLRLMAEAGNPWAIETLARCRLAGIKGAAKDRILNGRARLGDEQKAAIRLPPGRWRKEREVLANPGRGPFYDGDEPPWSEVLGERMARDRDPDHRGLSFWL
jgi:hypothetical protein